MHPTIAALLSCLQLGSSQEMKICPALSRFYPRMSDLYTGCCVGTRAARGMRDSAGSAGAAGGYGWAVGGGEGVPHGAAQNVTQPQDIGRPHNTPGMCLVGLVMCRAHCGGMDMCLVALMMCVAHHGGMGRNGWLAKSD